MTGDQHNIDNLFKSAIDGHEDHPSEESWKAIDKELNTNDIVSIRKRYDNLKKLVAILLILLFSMIGYEWHANKSNDTIAAASSLQQPIVSSVEASNNVRNIAQHILNLSSQQNITTSQITPSVVLNNANPFSYERQRLTKHHTNGKYIAHSTYNGIIGQADETGEITNSDNLGKSNSLIASTLDKSKESTVLPLVKNKEEKSTTTTQIKKNIEGNPKSAIIDNNRKLSKFSATVFVTPNITSDHLFDDDDDNHHDNADKIRHGERCQSSFTLGGLLEYRLNKHWSVQSGITFTNKVNSINPKFIYAENTGNGNVAYLFDFSSGYSYLSTKSSIPSVGDSAQTSLATNKLQYIGLPLLAKYTISKGRFNFNVLMGASFNILTKGNVETEIATNSGKEDEVVDKISGLKSDYLSGIIGIGTEYKLTKRLALNISPTMNLALTSITQNAPVRSYPNFFSFTTGLHVQL